MGEMRESITMEMVATETLGNYLADRPGLTATVLPWSPGGPPGRGIPFRFTGTFDQIASLVSEGWDMDVVRELRAVER